MSHVRYKENPAGQVKLDVDNVADGPHTVSRQVVRMAGSTLGALADVLDATPGSDARGLVARVVGGATDAALALVQAAVDAVRDRLPSALVGGRLSVDVGASVLPSGAATEATLAATQDRLPSALVGGRLSVDVGASALPSGAATEATLATRASESTLSTRAADATITARLGTLGQKAMAGSAPVVIASDQSAVPVSASSLPLPSGAATEATLATRAADSTAGAIRDRLPTALVGGRLSVDVGASALPSGAATESTLSTRAADATITARLGTLGQKAMTGSAPVVIASDQSAVPVSASSLPLPSGAATEATLSTRAADATVGAVRDRLPAAFTSGGGVKAGIVDALPSGGNTIGKVDQGAAGASGWPVNNDFTNAPEVLADQSGAGAVLTFTFSNSVVLVLVESLSGTTLVPGGLTCRITLGTSQTPTASLGVRCTDEKVYLPSHPITTVRVFAPSGTTVTCMGWRR